jgi:glutaconate CoA-transferase subunit A
MITVEQAVEPLQDGMTIGIAEFSYQNPPIHLIRELIRQDKKNLRLVSGPTSGLATDILIGAGCVQTVVTACVSFETVATIAPCFRPAVEKGEIIVWECDECMWHLALKAAALHVPYLLWQGGIGSDIPWLNHEIIHTIITPERNEIPVQSWDQLGRMLQQGVQGQHYLKIPAVSLDCCFGHAWRADERGYVQYPETRYLGRIFNERELAEATHGPVVYTVEEVVSKKEITRQPSLTVLRNAQVIPQPRGAFPGGCNGVYGPTLAVYREYCQQAQQWITLSQSDRRQAIMRWLNNILS